MRDEYDFIKVDVAIEIIAEMIADASIALETESDFNRIQDFNKKLEIYRKQREQIYLFNMEVVKYVIEVYGAELKKQR